MVAGKKVCRSLLSNVYNSPPQYAIAKLELFPHRTYTFSLLLTDDANATSFLVQ